MYSTVDLLEGSVSKDNALCERAAPALVVFSNGWQLPSRQANLWTSYNLTVVQHLGSAFLPSSKLVTACGRGDQIAGKDEAAFLTALRMYEDEHRAWHVPHHIDYRGRVRFVCLFSPHWTL